MCKWPIEAFASLAAIREAAEHARCPWPSGLTSARVVLIPKATSSGATEAIKLRPLTIMPLPYRVWAKLRARSLTAHLELGGLLPRSVQGYRPGHSAKETGFRLQLLCDAATAEDSQLGLCVLQI